MQSNTEKNLILEQIRQSPDYTCVGNSRPEPLRDTETGFSGKPNNTFIRQVRDSYGLCYEIWVEERWVPPLARELHAGVHFRRGSESVSTIHMSEFESIEHLERFFAVMWRSLGKPYAEPLLN